MKFSDSYLGKLRQKVGRQLLQVPGGRIVLERTDGEVLLQKRTDFGVWGLPGGSAELGESASDSIRRETFEETGLTVHQLNCFGFASNPTSETLTYPNGDQIQPFDLLFWSNSWVGTMPDSNAESLALAFFDLNHLPQMLAQHAKTLKMFQTFKETGEFQLD